MTSSHLDRHRIRDRLDASLDSQVTLVTGMAGAGKTTAVRQWLDFSNHHHSWLSLDARDNDPGRLWTRAAAAFCGEGTVEFTAHEDRADLLAEHLQASPSRVLVMDDLHFLVDTEILEQVGRFVRQLPSQHHPVLVSRSRPAIGLARLKGDNEVIELGPDELAFTHEELSALLAAPKAVVDDVERSTAGWPIAVGLARNLLTTNLEADIDWSVPHKDLADYLAEEVLSTLPVSAREFVRDCSILDEITVAAADPILDRDDSAAMIDHLLAAGLLDVTGPGAWSSHAIMRDVLREQLERAQPGRARELHKRASVYFAGHDLPRAIGYSLAADDFRGAVELIERNLPTLQDVLYATQLRWFEALPARYISGSPALCAHAALVAAYERHFPQADRWLRMREAFPADSVEELGALTMELTILGDLPKLRNVAARLRDRVSEDSTLWSVAHGALTGALRSTGATDAALAVITSMFREVRDVPDQFMAIQATARAVAARLLLDAGQLEQARIAIKDMRTWIDEAESAVSYRDFGAAMWAEAVMALEHGTVTTECWPHPPESEAALGLPFLEVWLLLDFARVRSAVGDDEQAMSALYRAQTRLSRFVDAGDLDDWLRSIGERYGIGPLPRVVSTAQSPAALLSEREAAVLELLDSDLSLREIAEQLSISQNTLKVHLRAVYRKLGVSSRLSAVRATRVI